MRAVNATALVGSIMIVTMAGCGAGQAAAPPSPSPPAPAASAPSAGESLMLRMPEDDAKIPNPGTGRADPRLQGALLTRFDPGPSVAPPVQAITPGAVRFPLRDTRSMYLAVRQISSPFIAPAACSTWTSGMWFTLVSRFAATTGAQLAASMYQTPGSEIGPDHITPHGAAAPQPRGSLTFSQSIITGPAQVMGILADERIPAECGRLTQTAGPAGRIEPLPVSPIGEHTWAYRLIDDKGFVWHWVQAIGLRGHLIEIRIPNQEPGPQGDMLRTLQHIAAQAHAKAAKTLP
ncbi:hypothetical protein [Thermomonospora umbrina]|uniref:Uncharacterized protein n=1 Tax=Thermomonospora umbrina TaxID=111806 RepID=A0A3D9T0X8_9ACTN|nr:hypothetical protein [Thermomonospora umbrina]REF00471.1 hypothetical protein DFJ69_6011 [Thermomonospora umbrina]